MRTKKSKTIGPRGYAYHVVQLGAREGGRTLVRLLKMVGAAAGAAMQKGKRVDMAVIGQVISNLAGSLSESDFDWLCDTFAKTTEVSGGEYGDKSIALVDKGVFDLHFAGAYPELGEWLLFVIEVNYSGFFPEGGVAAMLKKAAATAGADLPGSEAPAPEGKPDE